MTETNLLTVDSQTRKLKKIISALNNGFQFGIVNQKKEKRFLITIVLKFLMLFYPNPSKFNKNLLELKKQEAF